MISEKKVTMMDKVGQRSWERSSKVGTMSGICHQETSVYMLLGIGKAGNSGFVP